MRPFSVAKFGRNYILNIDQSEQSIDLISSNGNKKNKVPFLSVTLPFTVDFDITRNILSSANTSSFRIINLNANHRGILYKDPYTTFGYKGVEFKAGYGPQINTVFKGNVKEAFSVRENNNFVTTVQCYDGGFAFVNAEVSKSFPAGTPYNNILDDIISTLPAVTKGVVGDFPGSVARGNSVSGNSVKVLKELSGGAFFIDLEKANILKDEQCLPGSINVISSASGLLGTPKKEGTLLSVDMVFEPRLMIGQIVQLNSSTARQFNGTYKVISLHHRGTISDAVSGDAVTSVGLWIGDKKLLTVS